MATILNVLSIALLVFGFGFVVFWHELGHFLAAKAVKIKVEQFAVGFGQALLCWRKGIGFTVGTSAEKYRTLINSEFEKRKGLNLEFRDTETLSSESERKLANEIGLGETEYRLNWIPLGGYVKMLGQDDLDPNAQVNDPRAFNNRPVSARMVVISAGVIMNIILAAIFFVALFLIGYKVPPPLVGTVLPGSPAQAAGIQVGDRILSIDDRHIPDFTKIQYNTALLHEGSAVPVKLLRDGKEIELSVTPRKIKNDDAGFLMMGMSATPALRAPKQLINTLEDPASQIMPDALSLQAGDVVTAIEGKPITPEEPGKDIQIPSSYALLDRAVQASDGNPVHLTVRNTAGQTREITATPQLLREFDNDPLTIAGVYPRPLIYTIRNESSARKKLLPGDAVLAFQFDDTRELIPVASAGDLQEKLLLAGKDERLLTLIVSRNGQTREIGGLRPNYKISKGKYGLGVMPTEDIYSTYVASIAPGSAAARAGLPAGSHIVSVGGVNVSTLLQFRRQLINAGTNSVEVTYVRDPAPSTQPAAAPLAPRSVQFHLTDAELENLKSMRLTPALNFDERIEPRFTSNPVQAFVWGVAETRDLIVQGYVTIHRMAQRSVSPSNLTGPVGIFYAGGMIATNKSIDWTLWFLAMISANLAVVNFLPIPIVDGGHFLFLILEKIRGRPLSAKAQSITQVAGLMLILGVFFFVTYQDIMRML